MELIVDTRLYGDEGLGSLFLQLSHRLQVQPENGYFFLIFFLAIVHSFFAPKLHAIAREMKESRDKGFSFSAFLSFIGEVEVVFGLWAIPLLCLLAWDFGWSEMIRYVDLWDYQEPLYIFVTMAIASTYPILHAFEEISIRLLRFLKGESRTFWWLLLTLGPMTGAIFKEGVAMTLSLLILRKYLLHKLPTPLLYTTIALLLVNVSLAGGFTAFASSSSLIVSHSWGWTTPYIFTYFGIKSLLLILLMPTLTFFVFKKSLDDLGPLKVEDERVHVPLWVTIIHLLFLGGVIGLSGQPILFCGLFVLFLGFTEVTSRFQTPVPFRAAILVAFFLATVIVHAGLQGFWVEALLHHLETTYLLPVTMLLTSFNHNAAVAYLATLVPNLTEDMRQAIFSGIITGGGITLIANGPNMIGYRFLRETLGAEPSLMRLALAALPPTLISLLIFSL